MRFPTTRTALFLTVTLAVASTVMAKDKQKQKTTDRDRIDVEAHIAASGGPIQRFSATRHFNRLYVYAERGPGQPVTILDLTNPAKATVISQLESSSAVPSGNLVAVAGTAAIATSASAPANPATQTIRLMDFSDPANPKVTRQFEGVTAVEKFPNGLIALANSDGIWILSQHLADDPEVQERYARKVLYGEN
jgi:hypothetical protein